MAMDEEHTLYNDNNALNALYIGETLSPSLSTNPHQLHRFIIEQAQLPPKIHVSFRGTHLEEDKKNNNKNNNEAEKRNAQTTDSNSTNSRPRRRARNSKSRDSISIINPNYNSQRHTQYEAEDSPKVITDFNFSIDLTRHLVRRDGGIDTNKDGSGGPQHSRTNSKLRSLPLWHELHVNGESVGENPSADAAYPNEMMYDDEIEEDLNLLHPTEAKNKRTNMNSNHNLLGWCQQFCRDPSPVKSYVYFSYSYPYPNPSSALYIY